MCGIAGFCLARNEHVNENRLAAALLRACEVRGTHASGAAWIDSAGGYSLVKEPVRASVLVKRAGKTLAKDARTCVLHTRYATQGSPANRVNNHPIHRGTIVGVHNGHIYNDDMIFDTLDVVRKGEVDSEAAIAMLAYGGDPAPLMLPHLRGGAALAWMDTREKGHVLHLARVKSSPLTIGQTKAGSLVFCSTTPLLHQACKDAGVKLDYVWEVPEGTYMRIDRGRLVEMEEMPLDVYTGKGKTATLWDMADDFDAIDENLLRLALEGSD
jgi:glucosamine 6-phosphate synthetase-like amidotransferase/phosphosugar isomerase protein